MADETKIAWTNHTANFWMGCQKVSAGCANCYAETLTKNRMGLEVWGPPGKTSRQPVKSIWNNVRKWERDAASGATISVMGAGQPALVFVGSLMDWAEDASIPNGVRPKIWEVIRQSPNLHFQMLTKRAHRIADLLPADWGQGYPNVWLGTSIENMDAKDLLTGRPVAERADHLRQIPAAVRFVSYEPALGPLDSLNLSGIDWLIYGGESGPGYRHHDLAWPRAMERICADTGTAFFFKQSSAPRTEMGIELDGRIVRNFPIPRVPVSLSTATLFGRSETR